jgi:hypothetical protein
MRLQRDYPKLRQANHLAVMQLAARALVSPRVRARGLKDAKRGPSGSPDVPAADPALHVVDESVDFGEGLADLALHLLGARWHRCSTRPAPLGVVVSVVMVMVASEWGRPSRSRGG